MRSQLEPGRPGALDFAVVRLKGDWRILSETGAWGRFDHLVDAEEAALRLQARARRNGLTSTVLVQSISGEMTVLGDGAA